MAAGHLVINPTIKNWGPGGFCQPCSHRPGCPKQRGKGKLLLTCPRVVLLFSVGWTLRNDYVSGRGCLCFGGGHVLPLRLLLIAGPSFESRQSRLVPKATFSLLSLEGDDLLEVTTAFCRGLLGTEAVYPVAPERGSW